MPALGPGPGLETEAEPEAKAELEAEAEAEAELEAEPDAGLGPQAEPDAGLGAEAVAAIEAPSPPQVAETIEPREPEATFEDRPVVDEPLVRGVAPGQSLDEAIAAYEALLAAEEAEAFEEPDRGRSGGQR